MSSNFEIYQILLSGKKLTRSTYRRVDQKSENGDENTDSKVYHKAQKERRKQNLNQKCKWCQQPRSGPELCDECEQSHKKNQYCNVCKQIWKSKDGRNFILCSDCKVWVHKECDSLLGLHFRRFTLQSELKYRCPPCRHNVYLRLIDNIIRFLTYFDSEKHLWQLDQSVVKYFQVIHNPIDFVTIYQRNREGKYIGANDPEATFMSDVRLLTSNITEFHPQNTKPHRVGLLLKTIYELLLKRLKNSVKISDFDLLSYDEDQFNQDLVTRLTQEMSESFLNAAFGTSDLVQILGAPTYQPLWEPQLLSLTPKVEPRTTKNPLILWEKTVNPLIEYEKVDEVLVKLNMAEFTRFQVQQDLKLKVNVIKAVSNQHLHPFIDYLLELEPPEIAEEQSSKPLLQSLVNTLVMKDISKLTLVPIPLKVQPRQMLHHICYACGGYEHLCNLLVCEVCSQTYHFYCQIHNAQYVPRRVFAAHKKWSCNNCVVCSMCQKGGNSRSELFCCICNQFYHFKCALPKFISMHEPIDFWRCPACFQCRQCDSRVMLDEGRLSQMKPSTTSSTLHISVEYFSNFTLCLACGLEASMQRFCKYCDEYIQMDLFEEVVRPMIPEVFHFESELLRIFYEELQDPSPKVYLSCQTQKPALQCQKCLYYYHAACLLQNKQPMNEEQLCYDCTQNMSQLIFQFESLRKQQILQQIQAKSIKRIVPVVANFLEIRTQLSPDQQTFLLENIEQLDSLVQTYFNAAAGIDELKFELTGKRNAKDEYVDKLAQFWSSKFYFLENPSQTYSRSQVKRFELMSLYEVENDIFERVMMIQLRPLFVLSPQMLLSQRALPQFLGPLNKLARDSATLISDLQCLFIKHRRLGPLYSYVDDYYYLHYSNILSHYQQASYIQYAWKLGRNQLFYLPVHISVVRSLKKQISTYILESKQILAKENILIAKGTCRFALQALKSNIKSLCERFSDQQITDKFRLIYTYQKQIKTIIKEIQQLYAKKFPEIQSRQKLSEVTSISIQVEPPARVSQKPFPIRPDLPMNSPLNDQKCEFCKKSGNRTVSGRLLYVDGTRWVHVNCVLWNEDCKESELCVKQLLNSNTSVCEQCSLVGATIYCNKCNKKNHFYCAYQQHWLFSANKKVFCPACNESNEVGITEFSNWRKISVQIKQDRQQSKSILRFGNTILISLGITEQKQQLQEINLLVLRELPIYIKLDVKNSRLQIGYVDKKVFMAECEKDQQIFSQVAQLILEQNISHTFPVCRIDDLHHGLRQFGIKNINSDESFGQFFLLFTQHVRQKLLDKSQKVNHHQFTYFKQWFYLDFFVEDLPLETRINNVQYLSRIIHNDTSSYADHPMLFDAMPKPSIERTTSKLSRKETTITGTLQPNDLLEEAGLLTEESKVQDQQEELEKKLRVDYQKNKRPRLYVAPSLIHKYGLFTKQAIKRGELVIEYTGEVIRNALADYRELQYNEQGFGDCYMFRASKNSVIDATFKGSEARFLNHSCQPNCASTLIDEKILIYAKKNIAPCEELTYDYQFEIEAESEKIQCRCGAKNCIGRLN